MMKKITLLLILMVTALGYAQQQQYHLDFESGTPSGDAATWNNAFGGTSAVEIITNPDPDGTNTSATTKVLKTTLGAPLTAEFWAGIDNSESGEAFGTWKLDSNVANNLVLTMDVHKNYVGTIGIKWATTTSGTAFEIGNQNVDNIVVDEWQTLTWNLPIPAPTLETNLSDMIIFVDYTKTNGRVGGPSEYILHVDNIKWHAEKLTDPTGPTCDDGIQNGEETGVDCGGTSCADCVVVPSPSNAPTTPSIDGAMTISLFSDVYTDLAATWNPNWGQTTVVTDETIASNPLKKYASFNFSGVEPTGGTIDASTMTHVNIDYWTSDATELKIKLVDYRGDGAWGGDNIEIEITKTVTSTEAWGTISIPLTEFSAANTSFILTDIGQLVLSATGATNPVYLDNFYFSVGSALSIDKNELNNFRTYPNPTQDSWIVKTENIQMSSIQVFDVLGKNVLSLSPNSNEAKINGSSLKAGLYFAQIKTETGLNSIKLVKN